MHHSQQTLQGKQESWILSIFYFTSGHWLGVQLVEITGIFFPMISENVNFFDGVPVPSVLTQNPDCPSACFQFCCSCSCLHSSCFFPSITAMQDQFKPPSWWIHIKTHSFLNSSCLDLSSLSDLSQLTPLHLAYFPCLFVHFVVVFFINEILIDSLWCFSCFKVFSSPDEPCWT